MSSDEIRLVCLTLATAICGREDRRGDRVREHILETARKFADSVLVTSDEEIIRAARMLAERVNPPHD